MKQTIASQPRIYSWAEAVAGTGIGLIINIYAQHVVFPMLGIHIPWTINFAIAAIFTVISIVRSYFMRRLFNWIHVNIATKSF